MQLEGMGGPIGAETLGTPENRVSGMDVNMKRK